MWHILGRCLRIPFKCHARKIGLSFIGGEVLSLKRHGQICVLENAFWPQCGQRFGRGEAGSRETCSTGLHACAEEREGERCAGIPCLLSVLLKESWAFSFHLPMPLLFGGRLWAGFMAAASKTQNPRASRIPQSPPGETRARRSPRPLEASAQRRCPRITSVLFTVAWPSAGLSCSVLLPNPFVPPLQTFNLEISYS